MPAQGGGEGHFLLLATEKPQYIVRPSVDDREAFLPRSEIDHRVPKADLQQFFATTRKSFLDIRGRHLSSISHAMDGIHGFFLPLRWITSIPRTAPGCQGACFMAG